MKSPSRRAQGYPCAFFSVYEFCPRKERVNFRQLANRGPTWYCSESHQLRGCCFSLSSLGRAAVRREDTFPEYGKIFFPQRSARNDAESQHVESIEQQQTLGWTVVLVKACGEGKTWCV